QTLFIRVWEYGNNDFGTFKVSAYDASLSNASFDTSNFVAYPNPVKDVLNLSSKTAISNVKVINLLGQEVVNAKANTNDVQVDISALNAGAYIVNITVDDTVHSIKVIKE
ncbi:T9SS type A sorting domain-containing protein, partial [Mesomycoplasma ovipneumoniae]|uniref:T9SS type A sorting domain-containing protein n=1 Tax=Mesomycoplasma ovipneumoniae TaxID=29562 RepID=UPI003080C7E6